MTMQASRNAGSTSTEFAICDTIHPPGGQYLWCQNISLTLQEDFDEVMKTYPESFKAMGLVAEHRLRSLHRSSVWRERQQQQAGEAGPHGHGHLGAKIEQLLQVATPNAA